MASELVVRQTDPNKEVAVLQGALGWASKEPLTRKQAEQGFALVRAADWYKRHMLYILKERQAHTALRFDSFEEACEQMLGVEYSRSYVFDLLAWAEAERDIWRVICPQAVPDSSYAYEQSFNGSKPTNLPDDLPRLTARMAREICKLPAEYRGSVYKVGKETEQFSIPQRSLINIKHLVAQKLGEIEREKNGGAAPFHKNGDLVTDAEANATIGRTDAETPQEPQQEPDALPTVTQAEPEASAEPAESRTPDRRPAVTTTLVTTPARSHDTSPAQREDYQESAEIRNLKAQLAAYTSAADGPSVPVDADTLTMLDELCARGTGSRTRQDVVQSLILREWKRLVGSKGGIVE